MQDNLDPNRIPQHIAIIMDGNGRWARERNLSRTQGHIEGVRRVDEIVQLASELKMRALTIFAFSTENWQRPEEEVSTLMKIFSEVLKKEVSKLMKLNVQFRCIGSVDEAPEYLLKILEGVVEKTKDNTGMVLNMAFNYGGRAEIIRATKRIAQKVIDQSVQIDEINDKLFSDQMYTSGLPDPDLLIRTSGEKRISNFLLWQLSYSEFYFVDIYWPEFRKNEFLKAIKDYQNRDRRFGHLST